MFSNFIKIAIRQMMRQQWFTAINILGLSLGLASCLVYGLWDLQWWMFGVVGALAMLIAFFTVGGQAVKAALANPVKSLRSE